MKKLLITLLALLAALPAAAQTPISSARVPGGTLNSVQYQTGGLLFGGVTLGGNQILLGQSSGPPISSTISAAIDAAIGSTRGALLERGASGWSLLAPGTSGLCLTSNGTGADPSYQACSSGGSGTVATGALDGLAYYAAPGTTVSGLATGANGVLVTNGSGVPGISTTLPSGLTIPGYLTSNQSITLSGDTAGTGTTAITTTTTKVNGVAYSASPATNTVPIVTGSNTTTYEAVPNAALANSSITIAGHSVALGGSQALAAADLSNGTTGSGSAVLSTSPILVTPNLGTPSALNLANATGLPASALPSSGAAAGTYGDGTHVAQVTLDATGRVTSASSVAITAGGGGSAPGGSTYAVQFNAGSSAFGGASLGSGQFLIGQASGAPLPEALTGDCSASASGVLTCRRRVAFGDANYSIPASADYVVTNAALTAPRTATLPAASSVEAGDEITVYDEAGGVSSTNTLTVAGAGSDKIDGVASAAITEAYSGLRLRTDGASKWTIVGTMELGNLLGELNLSQLPTIGDQTVLGNISGGLAQPIPLNAAQLTTLCNIFSSSLSGCVPATAGVDTTYFLRSDGSWAVPAGAGGNVVGPSSSANNDCASFSGTSGTAIQDALGACVIEGGTAPGDANYSIASTDVTVYTTALTTARDWALPAANSVGKGHVVNIVDWAGVITASNTITISAIGSDHVNGGTTFVLSTQWSAIGLQSDGVSKWTVLYSSLISPISATAHYFLTGLGQGGAFTMAQPAVGDLQSVAANSVLGNATGSTAVPAALSMPSCSGASNALIWTAASGFGCNTIAAGGGTPGGSTNALQYNAGSGNLGGVSLGAGQVAVGQSSGAPVATTLGSAAFDNTGTSGATVPLLNGANTWSATQTFAAIGGYLANVTTQSGASYTLASTDCGTLIRFTNGSGVAITLPSGLATGCEVAMEQDGAGQLSLSAGSGATLHSAHGYSHTYGQYSMIGVAVNANSGGSSAVYVFSGDGS